MRVFLMAVGLIIASTAPAVAQEMPSWVAPQELSEAERPTQDRLSQEPQPNETGRAPFVCPDANPNCTDVIPAPVDGGLALLALLGTGYAVRRLRRVSDED